MSLIITANSISIKFPLGDYAQLIQRIGKLLSSYYFLNHT